MPIIFPNPDGVRHVPGGTIPIYQCPHCALFKTPNEYGIRLMNQAEVKGHGAEPEFRRQSWCLPCRVQSFAGRPEDTELSLFRDLFGTGMVEDLTDDPLDYLSDESFGS